MVNTRRTESIGSTPDISTNRHRTRRTVKQQQSDSSTVNETDSEESNAEEADSFDKEKPNESKSKSCRQLRNRTFVHERKQRTLRSKHKHISLNERHLTVYSNRNMHDDSDDSSGQYRGSRIRRRQHMTRIQRRTALSLRPIRQKCYADPHSPLQFNTDSEPEVNVRRSKRKVTSTSWLRDDQMHKVGYPNLNAGYSEEDSRDATEEIEVTRHVSKCTESTSKRREIKNPKYLFDYETNEPRRRRSDTRITRSDLRSRHESNDKENKEENSVITNGRLRSRGDANFKKDEEQSNDASSKSTENGVSNEATSTESSKKQSKEQESDSEDEDEAPRRQTRTKTRITNESFPRRKTKNQKIESSSSESEEERPKYSLRDRAPKQSEKKIESSLLRVSRDRNRTRRRYNVRRRQDSSSSSDSSSKFVQRKPPKSPHSKNEKMEKMKSGAGGSSKIIPIRPETLDTNVRFNSIGGLDGHIQCLKEMILLPMMYPEVFKQFQIQPPRGVLFHGPPGTGKTLIARALANECSFGIRKVAFFMRKGADLLSKWIGESEKQLRFLFEQAAEMKPSIIFFDELDGLAPVRSSRQDQVHASIVSTLLALMDGLDDRGEVIVIGATNRIDSIDPALRRPGRFDRELFFPLPSKKEREEILNVHVSQWSKKPLPQLISYLAETSIGYCGSDLRALCSEAVIMSFRRTYPQVYNSEHKLLINPENVVVEKIDFLRAKSLLVPASQRIVQSIGRKLLPFLEPLLQKTLNDVLAILKCTFPHGLNINLAKVKLSPNVRPAQLILTGDGAEHGQTSHLAPAILFQMEHIHSYLLDVATLYRETGRSPEEACIQVFHEAKRNVPSIIYIPNIDKWWELVNDTVRVILISQLSQLDTNIPILFMTTADTNFASLPEEIQSIFSHYRKEVYQVTAPNSECRRLFFKPLIIDKCLEQPRSPRKRPKTPPPLPRAPTPPPTPLTEEQARKLYETEEHTLRELRIFLRDMCKKLANNKLFYMFTKPVDTEEVPDYTTIIKQPMDLETMMTKVDFHRYECAKDFLKDIELICQNALEYNPAKTSADKQIRHRACSLRDYAYTLIKSEMDSDFEDKCQDISKKRIERKACVTKYLPAYINTPENMMLHPNPPPVNEDATQLENPNDEQTVKEADDKQSETEKTDEKTDTKIARVTPPVKKRKCNWQKGIVNNKKKKRQKLESSLDDQNDSKGSSMDESKENPLDSSEVNSKDSSDVNEKPINNGTEELTVDCSTQATAVDEPNLLQSPKRRLSDLMSPSDLLDNPLDFDDVDEALNETEGNPQVSNALIQCPLNELEEILDKIVSATEGYSLNSLLDLYNHLNLIVKKYARNHIRHSLPKELSLEIDRFLKDDVPETAQQI